MRIIIAVIISLIVAFGAGIVAPWVAALFDRLRAFLGLPSLIDEKRYVLADRSFLGLSKERVCSALYNVLLFVAMVTGILCNYFWLYGLHLPKDLSVFFRPVLVSPIVFLTVYTTSTKQSRGVVPVLLAFQNGFFWQTIFASAHNQVSPP
jgi:hypothetical protein